LSSCHYFHRKDVDVPDKLKRSLKGEDDETSKDTTDGLYEGDMIDVAKASFQSNQEAIEQSDLMRQVLQFYSDVKFTPFDYELRVNDASYTVTNRLEAYEMDDAVKNKPRYDTVASSSFVAKFIRKLKHCVKKQEWRKKSDTRTLLDGVNLKFESGKMYLVLGVSMIVDSVFLVCHSITFLHQSVLLIGTGSRKVNLVKVYCRLAS
jgi:hypothetical protein